jgi:hypothetical protein
LYGAGRCRLCAKPRARIGTLPFGGDFATIAASIARFNLVITSMRPWHILAGTLGQPVWLMLLP